MEWLSTSLLPKWIMKLKWPPICRRYRHKVTSHRVGPQVRPCDCRRATGLVCKGKARRANLERRPRHRAISAPSMNVRARSSNHHCVWIRSPLDVRIRELSLVSTALELRCPAPEETAPTLNSGVDQATPRLRIGNTPKTSLSSEACCAPRETRPTARGALTAGQQSPHRLSTGGTLGRRKLKDQVDTLWRWGIVFLLAIRRSQSPIMIFLSVLHNSSSPIPAYSSRI